jgi:MFS family permease
MGYLSILMIEEESWGAQDGSASKQRAQPVPCSALQPALKSNHDARYGAGRFGNLVEWYDFYAYTAFALYFGNSFFPGNDPVLQQLNTAVLFAIGFVMRPIGDWLFGHLADHRGRKNALMLSVVLMCFGSLVIAATPTYASIGAAAPVLLGLARIVQGLSLGGEYGASATYLMEVADEKHRGFYVSFHYVSLSEVSSATSSSCSFCSSFS